jgi:hypothetical protein
MKLNNFDKSIIIFTVILVAITTFMLIKNYVFMKDNSIHLQLNSYNTTPLSQELKTQSKKFQLFEDIYNSDGKIITYAIETNTLDRKNNEKFDKDFQEEFNNKNLADYKLVTYKDIDKIKEEYLIKNKDIVPETTGCGYGTLNEKEFDEFMQNVENCLINVCVINNKNNTITTITRDKNYIFDVLKKLN